MIVSISYSFNGKNLKMSKKCWGKTFKWLFKCSFRVNAWKENGRKNWLNWWIWMKGKQFQADSTALLCSLFMIWVKTCWNFTKLVSRLNEILHCFKKFWPNHSKWHHKPRRCDCRMSINQLGFNCIEFYLVTVNTFMWRLS